MTENREISSNNKPAGKLSADLYSELFSVNQKTINPKYVPLSEEKFDASQAQVKLIAFYLPQFHPIPENDEWWGKGFTEWTNVRKAVPNFEGHYQPRIPDDYLGYYDLRDIEIQKRQVELAKKYGVYGFCFYYYWFSGKRLLERPLDQFIEHTELDFPFCICWANENWTRRWDGRDDDVLIGQTHSEDEYVAFIRDVAPILLDQRYIRINEKPLLIVYHLTLLPDPKKAAEIWREQCRKLGVGEIYLTAIQSFGLEDPQAYGFDATIEFPPHNCLEGIAMVNKSNLKMTNPEFAGEVFEYRVAPQLVMNGPVPAYTKFRTVMPSWDNTPRRQNTGVIFVNSSPAIYKNWLQKAVDYTQSYLPEDEQFVFINAWNEWGECAYLEPDRVFGYAYLQATKEAVRKLDLLNDDEKLRLLKKRVLDLEIAVQLSVTQVAQKEEDVNILRAQILEKDKVIWEKDKVIQATKEAIGILTNSYTWRTGMFFKNIVDKLIPSEKKRSELKRWIVEFRGTQHRDDNQS